MRLLRSWFVGTLIMLVAGCATTGTPPAGGFATKCKDIDLTAVSLEPKPWPAGNQSRSSLAASYGSTTDGRRTPGRCTRSGFSTRTSRPSASRSSSARCRGSRTTEPPTPPESRPRQTFRTSGCSSSRRSEARARYRGSGGLLTCAGKPCAMPPDSPPARVPRRGQQRLERWGSPRSSGRPRDLCAADACAPHRERRRLQRDGEAALRGTAEEFVHELARKTCHGVQAQLGNG